MDIINPAYAGRKHGVLFVSMVIITVGSTVLSFSFLSDSHLYHQTTFVTEASAQSDLNVVRYRNLILDLGNGVSTNAQLTFPATGKGPYPGVLLIHGSGPADMNETLAKGVSKPFWQISNYLSERGFAVLRYDKRGIGEQSEIVDQELWRNVTIDTLIKDAETALDTLIQQPEVDPKRISLVGHSEGTIIAPRIALTNPTEVENVVLMGPAAQNLFDIVNFQMVRNPIFYAKQVLDKNDTGEIPIPTLVKDNFLKYDLLTTQFPEQNDSQSITGALLKLFNNDTTTKTGNISIENQIRPILIESFINDTENESTLCIKNACPKWWQSHSRLLPTLDVIGNVSSSIDILLLVGENDSQTPIQQALLLNQKLDEKGHRSHELKTYPNLGHVFYPSSKWDTSFGPIQPNVLEDLYSWLKSRSIQ